MTEARAEVTLDALAQQLEGLTDLFKRRLLDDRSKQAVIEDLQTRLTLAEKAVAAQSLRPLVDGLALVIERLEGADPETDIRTSVIDELQYVLESIGVTTITAIPGDAVDRLEHEVASATGEGPTLLVGAQLRAGYRKDGVVLRPARITAERTGSDPQAADGHAGDE